MPFFEELNNNHLNFIKEQKIFFVASSASEGRVNLSPKGMDYFKVINTKLAGYLDLIGSGNETSAHIKKDGRLTIMMCSFNKIPYILRLYGLGEVINCNENLWDEYKDVFPKIKGTRQIILIHIKSVQKSCGLSVPYMNFIEHRYKLNELWERKDENFALEYMNKKNKYSIDGFPTGLYINNDNKKDK